MDNNKLEAIERFIEKYGSNEKSCTICPRGCGVDRNTELGECREPFNPRVSSANLHNGEEPPVSGIHGSGTIFLTGCNLHCVFCQNYPISQLHDANRQCDIETFADMMVRLQKRRAHNINFVTPSHYVYQIVLGLREAIKRGFDIPVVYNTSGYDRAEIISDLAGIVDVFLPDAKYADNSVALRYSDAPNYVEINRAMLLRIYDKFGSDIEFGEWGIAKRGMIIRHLVIPGEVENSKAVLKWIAENLSPKVYLSLMSQYFPAYRASSEPKFDNINRRLSHREYEDVVDFAEGLGFENGWFQEG